MRGVDRLSIALVGVASLFSSYHIALGALSLRNLPREDWPPVLVALLLDAAATVAALWGVLARPRLSLPLTMFALAVSVTVPLLVTSVVNSTELGATDFRTWHIGAVCALLTIICVRRRAPFAWWGVGVLALETLIWAGPLSLLSLGLFGSTIWVAVGQAMSSTVRRTLDDVAKVTTAERAASEWQATQLAHLTERQFRLGQTGSRAMPMLERIRASNGELDDLERMECLWLEGSIRDEIRGRLLLDDRVREQVARARRRGIVVTLLDEGGIDHLPERDLARVHEVIAETLRDADADRVIVRTVPAGGPTAVTIVGLRVPDGGIASALARDDVEDEVTLWVEVPRLTVS